MTFATTIHSQRTVMRLGIAVAAALAMLTITFLVEAQEPVQPPPNPAGETDAAQQSPESG